MTLLIFNVKLLSRLRSFAFDIWSPFRFGLNISKMITSLIRSYGNYFRFVLSRCFKWLVFLKVLFFDCRKRFNLRLLSLLSFYLFFLVLNDYDLGILNIISNIKIYLRLKLFLILSWARSVPDVLIPMKLINNICCCDGCCFDHVYIFFNSSTYLELNVLIFILYYYFLLFFLFMIYRQIFLAIKFIVLFR